ncbi:hypothetical protein ACFY05_32415 [Microtetraspora fusca]|uniref:Uncharacterized protein n=1 Tax=Microtetraspora fusca TaxID=1997 RepID=A0ABW6VG65_MICFU
MQISVPEYRTAAAAVDEAEYLISSLQILLNHTGGTRVASTVHVLATGARLLLEQASANDRHPDTPTHLDYVWKWLKEVTANYYASLDHEQRVHIAAERGVMHAEHLEFEDRNGRPALVYLLDDAYPPDSLSKAKIQAKALQRVGKHREAEALLVAAAEAQPDAA